MNKEILRMQMLSGIITESEYKAKLKKNKSPLNENLKFSQIEKDRKYFATTNFGIFKKGDEVFVDTVRNLGNEVVIELSNNKGKSDSIKGDLEDEVEVFDNDMKESLNENFVGMGMVGNIFDREKTDYEIAFEHFTKSTSLNEKMEEVEEGNLYHNEIYSIEPEGRFWIVTYTNMDGQKEKVFQSEDEAREFASTLEESEEIKLQENQDIPNDIE
jgi:hypothetical protein